MSHWQFHPSSVHTFGSTSGFGKIKNSDRAKLDETMMRRFDITVHEQPHMLMPRKIISKEKKEIIFRLDTKISDVSKQAFRETIGKDGKRGDNYAVHVTIHSAAGDKDKKLIDYAEAMTELGKETNFQSKLSLLI